MTLFGCNDYGVWWKHTQFILTVERYSYVRDVIWSYVRSVAHVPLSDWVIGNSGTVHNGGKENGNAIFGRIVNHFEKELCTNSRSHRVTLFTILPNTIMPFTILPNTMLPFSFPQLCTVQPLPITRPVYDERYVYMKEDTLLGNLMHKCIVDIISFSNVHIVIVHWQYSYGAMKG